MTPTSDDARRAWDRLRETRFMMLTTLDADGGFYSCPMTLQRAEDGGVLWFFTSMSTPTARNVERDPRIGAALMGDDGKFYAAVYGSASLQRDRARMREFWDPVVQAFFPQGVEDPEIVLVRFDIERGEYWDGDQNTLLKMFSYAKASVTGTRPDAGKHGELQTTSEGAR